MTNTVVPITPESSSSTATPRPEVFLQPIAAPSILGLYGFSAATFMVAANMAHWFGDARSALFLAPFAAVFGGLAQFLAGMWGFKARDGLATAMHGMWGSFWIAYGLLQLGVARGLPQGAEPSQALGFWFITLAAITWVGMVAATAESKGLAWVLGTLALGSTLAAIGNLVGSGGVKIAAGWIFILSAIIAWYTASALMMEATTGHAWPLGKTARARQAARINLGLGEPGVKHGQ